MWSLPIREAPAMAGINWLDWNDEAFKKAMDEAKPILLAIGATWCHWCHVMDQTTYSDPQVIEAVNASFVPIRVDNDRRPDLNERYNMGGWPTTCFLTPQGEIIAGATFIPPTDMLDVLDRVLHHYRSNREALEAQFAQIRSAPRISPSDSTALSASTVDAVVQQVLDAYDPAYGGFGTGQKFPAPDAIALLIDQYCHTGRPSLMGPVTTTLRAQRTGGTYDHEMGGFFRYSTTRDWGVPHYEKMLDDQAGHIYTYSQAYCVTGDPWYLEVVRHVYGYVHSTLWDPQNGAFFGSQDADQHYYLLPLAKRMSTPAPAVDTTIYTDWNAHMASALLAAYASSENEQYLHDALACLNWLLRNSRDRDGRLCHYHDDAPHLPGLLRDQAAVAEAAISAYQATADESYLASAIDILGYCRSALLDQDTGAFCDVPPDHQQLGQLARREHPMLENALIARVLADLAALTADGSYLTMAERCLYPFAHQWARWGHLASAFGRAVDAVLADPVTVRVIGPRNNHLTQQLAKAAFVFYRPHKVVQVLDPAVDMARIEQLGLPPSAAPRAFVCSGSTCLAPVGDPKALASALNQVNMALMA
jgi:uncharacterized protein YyaL (SSP411 family)